jgi:hypothetical protein
VGSGKGFVDGALQSAKFNKPQGIFFDSIDQSLLVCDFGNHILRKVSIQKGQ